MKIFKFLVKDSENIRIDKFLAEKTEISRRNVKKIISGGGCFLNGKRCHIQGYVLKKGDRIKLCYPEDLNYFDYKLSGEDIVFEDRYFMIINKVSGVPVNLSATGAEGSIQKGVENYFREHGINHRPAIIHRLDMRTSGLLIFSKSKRLERMFYDMFRKREIEKEYIALLCGTLREKKGRIKTKIAKDPKFLNKYKVAYNRGKEAVTRFKVLSERENLSLVKLIPKTGRPHQLRVHMSFYGNPILGDKLYGGDISNRLYLHAYKLTFSHPITDEEVSLTVMPQSDWRFFKEEIKKLVKS